MIKGSYKASLQNQTQNVSKQYTTSKLSNQLGQTNRATHPSTCIYLHGNKALKKQTICLHTSPAQNSTLPSCDRILRHHTAQSFALAGNAGVAIEPCACRGSAGWGPLFVINKLGAGDVAQLLERRTGTPLRQVGFPGAARDFSPRVNFQGKLSYGVRAAPVRNRSH